MESLFCIVCVCCMSRSQAKLVGKCEMFRLGTIDFGTKRSSANTFFPRRSPSRSLHSLWFRALPLTLSFFYFTLSDSILCATAVWFEKMWVRKATTSPFLLTNTCKYSHIVYLCVRARVRANTHTHMNVMFHSYCRCWWWCYCYCCRYRFRCLPPLFCMGIFVSHISFVYAWRCMCARDDCRKKREQERKGEC